MNEFIDTTSNRAVFLPLGQFYHVDERLDQLQITDQSTVAYHWVLWIILVVVCCGVILCSFFIV